MKTGSQIYLQKTSSCMNLQLPILVLKRIIMSDMPHRITSIYINFQQNQYCRLVKIVLINLLQKHTDCISLQLPIVILKKIDYFKHASRITYMYINCQKNQVCRLVKTVHTNLFSALEHIYL